MSQKANYFRLGVFILVAIAVFIALVLALSAGQLFERTAKMETYFNESVQGLDVGSAVKYRGVQLGRVTKISFTSTKYQLDLPPQGRKQYVLVEAELQPEIVGASPAPQQERLHEMIVSGLRARLAPVGITGTAYLEIDYVDPRIPLLEIAWTPENIYIPSAPSTYNQIVSGAQRFLAMLDKADIEGLVRSVGLLARTATDKLGELQLGALSHDASIAMREVRQLTARLDKLAASPELTATLRDLGAASGRLRDVLSNPSWSTAPTEASQAFATVKALAENKHLQDALIRLDRTLTRLDTLTAGSDADITTAITNLRRATDNLRDFTETAKRYPGSLFGQPPEPVTLPPR